MRLEFAQVEHTSEGGSVQVSRMRDGPQKRANTQRIERTRKNAKKETKQSKVDETNNTEKGCSGCLETAIRGQ